MIKTVIFDIDNTLYSYDTAHIYGMEALVRYCQDAFHLPQDSILRCYDRAQNIMMQRIGTDTAAIHSRMLRFQCMTELLSQPLFPHVENMYHSYWDTLIDHSQPSPGVLRLCSELKKRQIRIGIGTDMTASIQYEKIKKLGFVPYIDFIVTSQEAGVEKPHPHFFELCVEKSECKPEECAFIGDNLIKDVKGASDCGLLGIWYSQEKTPNKEINNPTIISYGDLEHFFQICKLVE